MVVTMRTRTIATAALSTALGIAIVEAGVAWSSFRFSSPPPAAPAVPTGAFEATVDRVLETSDGPVVLLRLPEARALPIWIGHAEARAIERLLHQQPFPRPLTHDLMAGLVGALDAEVHHVRVRSLRADGVYLGAVALQSPDGPRVVDARPSDAIALALRTGAPIYVADTLEPHTLAISTR